MPVYDLCEIEQSSPFPSAIDIDRNFIPPEECNVTHLYAQLERGAETSKPHIQAYVEVGGSRDEWPTWNEMVNDAKWKKVFGDGKEAHITPAYASREANKQYCSKEGQGGRIQGTVNYVFDKEERQDVQAPRRTSQEDEDRKEEKKMRGKEKTALFNQKKLAAAYELMQKAVDAGEPIEWCVLAAHTQFQNYKQQEGQDINEYRETLALYQGIYNHFATKTKVMEGCLMAMERKKSVDRGLSGVVRVRQIWCYVYWGGTGTGKSTRAQTDFIEYGVPFTKDTSLKWWNGYTNQNVLVLEELGHDEVTPETVIGPKELLRILDGYEYRVDIKTKEPRLAMWTIVVITSNYDFDHWFCSWRGIGTETKKAIESRIHARVHFSGDDLRKRRREDITPPERKEGATLEYVVPRKQGNN